MKDTNEIQVTRYVTDTDGNILEYLYEGDRILRKSQSEYLDKYNTNFKSREAFVKVYVSIIADMYKELTAREFATAMSLIPFISYKDGVLRNQITNEVITIKEMSEILEEKYETYKRAFKGLYEKGIVKKVTYKKDGDKNKNCIIVNPNIFLRGRDIEKKSIELFSNTIWADYCDKMDTTFTGD